MQIHGKCTKNTENRTGIDLVVFNGAANRQGDANHRIEGPPKQGTTEAGDHTSYPSLEGQMR